MKFYHLSHTDLDGYGAQFITNFYFKDIKFSNSNYGREIDEKFGAIVSELGDEEAVILITDLNLTMTQCESYETALQGKNAKLFLLDHHQSGAECASAYPWYFLDSSRCATKITYDFFASMFVQNTELKKFSDVVNAVDIWLKDDVDFEMGKVCLGLIANAKEINRVMFERENNLYMFHLLLHAQQFFNAKNDYIGLDMQIYTIKKEFFKFDKDDTLSNLISAYVVRLLSKNRDKFSIRYNGFNGILTYNIGNTSVIGNDFLVANPDFDFFIDITNKKTMSFRANGKIDVSAMAKRLVGGGGHVNASGGMFSNFKDSFEYEMIKSQVVDLINKKTQEGL
ncbi:3'-to-5' oligoribonuclease B [Campylobacter sp. faydin G-105]|uniref:DHH family phosphoesterase n=1 Tax=Campylobacter anatolicus TaxID=2829105 RepID=UPI001B9BD76E|nr:3'-to-5' oligoribonuclease B [Campylobacter anatolicus]MBR8462017.1 3'-to-5' oligoribonuclease B [Campylobacter anatolicus]